MKKVLLSFCLVLAAASAMAQAGSLDNSFGTNGRVNIGLGVYDDFANAVAVQADGKIVVAGFSRITELNNGNRHDFSVARLNADGTLDNTFDGDGKVIITVGDFGGFAYAVKIQNDGKILVAGSSINADGFQDYTVVRLNADGSLDNNFDGDGRVYLSIGLGDDICFAMALQPDDKIVLAGQTDIDFSDIGFSVVRLNSNGTPDVTFDADGKKFIPVNGTTFDAVSSVAIQPDGNIVLAGTGRTSNPTTRHFSVVRLTTTGDYDPGFDTDGETVLITTNSSFCRAMVLQPDGKILLAGNSGENGGYQVVRLNSAGTLDNSFDTDGRLFVAVGAGSDVYSMALQTDGKIVVAGQSGDGSVAGFSAIRLNTNGTLDPCFDEDGKVILPSAVGGSLTERNRAMALRSDGKIVLAGVNGNVNSFPTNPAIDFIVMRLNGGGSGTGQDLDGDGYSSCVDCDDNNPNINPGATETCNGIDDNCNGQVDEGLTSTFYRDADGDGFGSPVNTIQACTVPAGYVTDNTDCDDTKFLYLDSDGDGYGTGSPIACGADNNTDCNDADINIHATVTYYRDADGDGFGDANATTSVCQPAPPSGYVSNSLDCDDTKLFYVDSDGDGYGAGAAIPCGVATNTDCNDNNPAVNPGVLFDICNDIDDDCDGLTDEDVPKITIYVDSDNDTWGDVSQSMQSCIIPPGYSDRAGDCADNNPNIHPTAPDICNGVDDDCDGMIDENVILSFYVDNDGDGFGVISNQVQACTAPPGYTDQAGDCNDNDPNINPDASEICNGIDDNCNGEVDEGTLTRFYRDNDQDGYGNGSASLLACSPPAGYVDNSEDCDDFDFNIKPGTTEICNEKDDDCDGQVDEDITIPTWYQDEDGDGYGNPNSSLQSCIQPQGYVNNNSDCDDSNDTIYPNAPEFCNGIDENCNGITDDNAVLITWYRDADNDSWGDPNQTVQACVPPAGYIRETFDCDDTNPNINPSATEIDNNLDDDCDGQIDEDILITFSRDADDDGFGDAANSTQANTQPDGYVANNTDCNDNNAAINPDAAEVCDGVDNNCNGQVDEGVKLTFFRDADTDGFGDPTNTTQACSVPTGYVTNSADCNDNNAAINPDADEVCDGVDDNCNGQVDEGVELMFFRDADADGFGDPNNTTQACSVPTGYVTNNTDCNENNAAINPDAAEVCDGVDNNCNGQVDEGVNLTFYRDFDGDGFGDPNNTTQACTAPAGYVTNNTDCNDNNAAINPDAAEVCDGVDNNCNGQVDEGVNLTFFRDADADGFGDPNNTTQACSVPAGYVTNNSDCDDGNASINPNTVWYLDADNDNYHIGSGITECISPGPGYKISGLIAGGDCNDGNSTINPGATEACGNNLDDNCNDQINEGCPTTPTVSINDVTVYESQGQAILTVSLSGPSATPIKFNYKTIDGTAIKAKDYKNSNGNITIPAGNLSAQITIAIIQDNISEGEEFFDVRISLPKVTGQIQPAVIGDDLGEVTILDAVAPTLTKTAPRNINNNNLTKPESENLKISVMPNPSETDFILNIASGNSDPCYISVFDINGRLVKRIKSRSANIRFGRDLSSGVYIIEVEQKRNKKTLKAVKL